MKKRLTSILLTICILLSILPISSVTVMAAEKNYNDSDVTWLGTTTEYKKTLKSMYDSGLRKVPVGVMSADGSLSKIKYGLVDLNGKFAAQPIYDKIEAEYIWTENNHGMQKYPDNANESIFVDGYVQATRGGKMGLLDKKGKEVIPCKYHAVGLPAEGICRVIRKSGKKFYLGYWNLKLKKEIVAPNKYIVSGSDATAIGSMMGYTSGFAEDKKNSALRYAARFDFNGGYALVPTGKTKKAVQIHVGGDSPNVTTYLAYAQIINTKGKAILSKGAVPYRLNYYIYPQAGPYMVYQKLSKKKLVMITDQGDTCTFKTHLESGVVGPKGVIIPAQYHAGILGSATKWYPGDANMMIIPKKSMVVTNKCGYTKFHESAARTGVINFKNKTILPFNGKVAGYDTKYNVFFGYGIYKPNGKLIPKTNLNSLSMSNGSLAYVVNGYCILANNKGHIGLVNIKTGKVYTHKNIQSKYIGYGSKVQASRSNVSSAGTLWVNKGTAKKAKWGLVTIKGKVLLPFKYEKIEAFDDLWEKSKDAYASVMLNGKWGLVNTKGKTILPCKYKSIGENVQGYMTITDSYGKIGVFNFNTRKITADCGKANGIRMTSRPSSGSGVIMGTATFNIGNSQNALINMDTGKIITPTYFSISTTSGGLFYCSSYDTFGPDGKIVFPRDACYASYNGRQTYIGEDLTLIVKSGKVGYINASRLKRSDQPLPTTPLPKFEPLPRTTSYHLIAYPNKQLYKIGEAFDLSGLIVHFQDENGVRSVINNSQLRFFTSKTVELTQGRPFTTTGVKDIEIRHNDKTLSNVSFQVKIIDADVLDSGNYYMKIYDKYIYPVKASGIYYMELSDKKPSKPYIVKLLNYSEDRGPMYSIAYDGTYICQPSSSDGAQLQSSSIPHMWRINKYSTFCTIRDYGKQSLLVNASEQNNANGTKVIVWTLTGSAPANGKISIIKA